MIKKVVKCMICKEKFTGKAALKHTKETEHDDGTHIRVSGEVFAWLNSKKIHSRQSFNEVLEDIKNKEGDE